MRDYNVVVTVNFEVTVDADNESDAIALAEEKISKALAPWDMPDHDIIDVMTFPA